MLVEEVTKASSLQPGQKSPVHTRVHVCVLVRGPQGGLCSHPASSAMLLKETARPLVPMQAEPQKACLRAGVGGWAQTST